MGDVSNEPSMEHILSSIKRIIAEDGDGAAPERRERRPARAPLARPREEDDVLELSETMAEESGTEESVGETEYEDEETMADMPDAIDTREQPPRPDLVSPQAAAASKTSLDALSRLVVRPEVTGTDTLEGMVREMLKPMLAEWLDANLPTIVDQQVAREIARITGR